MDTQTFKALLDAEHQWPGPYTFKFIVPTDKLPAVAALFPGTEPNLRPSGGGKYTSATFAVMMLSSEAVLELYAQAALIDGLLSL